MTSYFNTCDVTVVNLNHKNVPGHFMSTVPASQPTISDFPQIS